MKKYLLVTALFLAFPSASIAKTINLYETPNNNSKITSTADSDVGIIPIFTPKQSNWIKIADPRNGNVGWAKSEDLNNIKFNFVFLRTNGKNGWEVNQYTSEGSSEHAREIIQKMLVQQQSLRKEIEKNMENTFKTMNELFSPSSHK